MVNIPYDMDPIGILDQHETGIFPQSAPTCELEKL